MTKSKKRYKDKCKKVTVTFYLKDRDLYEYALLKAIQYGSVEKYIKTLIAKDVHDEQFNEEMKTLNAIMDEIENAKRG